MGAGWQRHPALLPTVDVWWFFHKPACQSIHMDGLIQAACPIEVAHSRPGGRKVVPLLPEAINLTACVCFVNTTLGSVC